ncbi:MAG: hypothetical protein NTX79_01910 [Candidatus Micrarchaeota archaeon]|nr:hypothetical protein [Candidatus Micrarchaeota archaeon]
MVKARQPKKTPRTVKAIAVGLLLGVVHLVFVIFMVISGINVIARYLDILGGNLPSEIQKAILDYSLTVFAGTAAFILIYRYKFEDTVYEIFDVKRVKPYGKSREGD